MAGSRTIPATSSSNRPIAPAAIVRCCSYISSATFTLAMLVAKWSCQSHVSFSVSGRRVATMRSSHHRTIARRSVLAVCWAVRRSSMLRSSPRPWRISAVRNVGGVTAAAAASGVGSSSRSTASG